MKLNKKTMLVIIYVLINTMLLVLFLNNINHNNKTKNLEQYLFLFINYPTSTIAFFYFEFCSSVGSHYTSKLEEIFAYLNYFVGFIQWYYIIFFFKKKDLKKIKIISLIAIIITTITLILCNDIRPYFYSKFIVHNLEGNLACCDKDADTY